LHAHGRPSLSFARSWRERIEAPRPAILPCAGFSDAGNDEPSARWVAGVGEAPRHEIAAGGSAAAVPQALWGFGHGRELEAGRFAEGYPGRTGIQLKRYGTNIAKWGIHVLSHP